MLAALAAVPRGRDLLQITPSAENSALQLEDGSREKLPILAELNPSEMSCVCPLNRWPPPRSSSWKYKEKKSGTKESFLISFCYAALYRDLGFQSKGRDFISPFASLARVPSNSWHSQKVSILTFLSRWKLQERHRDTERLSKAYVWEIRKPMGHMSFVKHKAY